MPAKIAVAMSNRGMFGSFCWEAPRLSFGSPNLHHKDDDAIRTLADEVD
jgi:hypothetical protein